MDFIVAPIVHPGFLGFSGVLLAILVWMIRRLLEVLDSTNKIIAGNTEAIRELATMAKTGNSMTADLLELTRATHEKIISRPCIAQREG